MDAEFRALGVDRHRRGQDLETYRLLCSEAGRTQRGVTLRRALPAEDAQTTLDLVDAYRQPGVERLVCTLRYDRVSEFAAQADRLAQLLL